MSRYYWCVPVRADRDCEPLDLMRSERPRSLGTCSLKWTIWVHQIENQRWKIKGRGAHRFVLGFRRGHRQCGQMVDVGVIPVSYRGQEEDDWVQGDTGISSVWTTMSIAPWCGRGGRLERCSVQGSFRSSCSHHSAAGQNQVGVSGGAPCLGEVGRGEEEDWGSPSMTNSTGRTCRCAELRRAISRSRQHIGQRGKRDEGGVLGATYSQSWRGRGARVWQDQTEGSGAVREEETSGRKGMTRGPGRSEEEGDLMVGTQCQWKRWREAYPFGR
jgi:hypothetical protein